MKEDKEFIKNLKKKITKDWGKECKDYQPICGICVIWHAVKTLEEMYKYTI